MPGFPELVVILIILVIVFGAKAFPRLGEAVGRLIARSATGKDRTDPSHPPDGPPT